MIVQASTRVIPPSILRRVPDRGAFLYEVGRYNAMEDDELLRATNVCLRNLDSLDDCVAGPDSDLQLVLVPELWERLRSGTRDALRRLGSTLAEYDATRPSIFAERLSSETLSRLREGAASLRQRVAHAVHLDVPALIEQVRFAIAGSRAADHWPPDALVYEPGFAYRLVPAIAGRVLVRSHRRSP